VKSSWGDFQIRIALNRMSKREPTRYLDMAPAASGGLQPSKSRRSRLVRWLRQRCYANHIGPRRLYREPCEQFATSSTQILDIGCGYSAPDLESLRAGRAVKVGLDMVSRFCEADAPSVQFVRGDCHAMPFQDGRFDLVMCRSVLEHLEDPQAVFCEVARVLAPGGHFVFLTPNRWDYVSVLANLIPNRFHQQVVRVMTGRAEEDTFPTFYRANSRGRIRKLARVAKLRIQQLTMPREHPHYLQFNALAYALGTCYEKVLERNVKHIRPWILGVCTHQNDDNAEPTHP